MRRDEKKTTQQSHLLALNSDGTTLAWTPP